MHVLYVIASSGGTTIMLVFFSFGWVGGYLLESASFAAGIPISQLHNISFCYWQELYCCEPPHILCGEKSGQYHSTLLLPPGEKMELLNSKAIETL